MYIGGKPAGLMTMSTRDGQPLPDWLTPGYIKDVLEEIDIGSQYIALLKRLLIDDPTESVQRQALYKDLLTRLHNDAVYLPISYVSMMVVARPELGAIPYAPIASEIPFEQIKPVKP